MLLYINVTYHDRLNVTGICAQQHFILRFRYVLDYHNMNAIIDCCSLCMMSMSLDGNCKEQLKTQFVTREGIYKLLALATYSRPNRIGYSLQTNTSVHVSFISYSNSNDDKICFNIGRELYIFFYKGTKKVTLLLNVILDPYFLILLSCFINHNPKILM